MLMRYWLNPGAFLQKVARIACDSTHCRIPAVDMPATVARPTYGKRCGLTANPQSLTYSDLIVSGLHLVELTQLWYR